MHLGNWLLFLWENMVYDYRKINKEKRCFCKRKKKDELQIVLGKNAGV
jgi:hypothetical protein